MIFFLVFSSINFLNILYTIGKIFGAETIENVRIYQEKFKMYMFRAF